MRMMLTGVVILLVASGLCLHTRTKTRSVLIGFHFTCFLLVFFRGFVR